jgi:predicted nucleic acid-binding protein
MILDTNFIIALREGQDPAKEVAADLESQSLPLRVPTVVVQELYVGVGAGSQPHQNARDYEALVANKPIVPLDETISRQAGVIEGQHIASETKPTLGLADSVVAATGLVFNEPVVTDDTSDFETVDGLDVVIPGTSPEQ